MKTKLLSLGKKFPVVSILGPRQSGKTVLSKESFPNLPYINFEKPSQRELALHDAEKFLEKFSEGVILDEIQRIPELLSYIQDIVDNSRPKGPFILTGSNQYELSADISQSLAGRNAILRLLPFTITEIMPYEKNPDSLCYRGFFPRIYNESIDVEDFLNNYIDNYLQRDVRNILNVKNLGQFERFLSLCAGRNGQILNLSQLGNETGLSHNSIRQWISVLESSGIIYLLKPYHNNFNKRIIKSPKLYFTDSGLACRLLGIQSEDQLKTHPLYGSLFESMIVSDILKQYYNRGKRPQCYYFRDHIGNEIDMILDTAEGIVAIEIKSSKTFNRKFFNTLNYFSKFSDLIPENRLLVSGSDIEQTSSSGTLIPWNKIGQYVNKII